MVYLRVPTVVFYIIQATGIGFRRAAIPAVMRVSSSSSSVM